MSFLDYEESPCALVDAGCANLDWSNLDNLFNIDISGYVGIEGYMFDDFEPFSDDNQKPLLVSIKNEDYLPKRLRFYYECDGKKLNVFKFSKAVLCNEALIKWIDAGICAFENYYVEKDNDEYYLVNDDEKIKLNDELRWCDIKGLNVLNHDNSKWQERMQNYKIAYKNRLNRTLK